VLYANLLAAYEIVGGAVRLIILVACLACLWLGAARADETEIGMVKTLKGQVFVTHAGARESARIGEKVYQNDTVETGEDGAIGITFVDNTTISLGPQSQIALTSFVFDPQSDKFAFAANLAKGTLMYASGLIGKLSPQSVSVQTPVSTIGIRGTRFLVKVAP